MGNYTRYELTVEPKGLSAGMSAGDGADLIGKLRAESEGAEYALQEDGSSEEAAKWYGHEEDLLAFSAKKPGWLFTLNGAGEEAGDVWRKYFFEGKVQRAPVSFEEFDEAKLVGVEASAAPTPYGPLRSF